MPDPTSTTLSVTVTGETYQSSCPFGSSGDRTGFVSGGVESSLIVTVSGPAVPTEFVAVHDTVNVPSFAKSWSTQPSL